MTENGWLESHPDDRQLVAFVDGELDPSLAESVTAHVGSCLRCRRRLSGLQPAIDTGDPRLPERPAHVKEPLVRALAELSSGEPAPGELWRVVGSDEAVVVWVLRLHDDMVRVVPCSLDVELADEYTLIVDESDSPLGLPLALHTTIETELPSELFNARIGQLDVAEEVEGLRAARKQGRPAPSEVKVGPPIADAIDERISFREALAATVAKLALAEAQLDEEIEEKPPSPGVEISADLAAYVIREHLADELAAALRLRRPSARVTTDDWPAMNTRLGAMRPLLAVQEFAVRIVLCAVPVQDMSLLDDDELVRRAGELLRARNDVARVALVAADPDRTTRVRDLYDTAPEVVSTPTGNLGRPRPSRPLLPLADAVVLGLEELLPNFEPLGEGLVAPGRINFTEIANQVSREALAAVKGKRAVIEEKKAALRGLSERDEAGIAAMVERARASGPDGLEDAVDDLVGLAS